MININYLFTMAEGGEHNLTDNGSEPVYDFYCELCREDGNILEAEGYCVNCGEYLCSTCYTHHRRTRNSRHHELMDKDKMPKDTPLSCDRVSKDITRVCEHHAGEPVKYYCKSHDVLGCSICFIEGHRNCSNIEHIAKVAESVMESQEYKEFIQMLNQCDQGARNNIKLVQDNLAKSKHCCLEVAESLQRYREEINSVLDELEKSILTQSDDLHREEEEKLLSVSEKFTSSLELVEKIKGELSELQKSRKVCDLYIRLKESKRGVTDIQAKLREAEKGNVVREFVFDPNTELKKSLRSQHGLGKLSVQASVYAVGMALPHGKISNPVNTKATHVTDIEVKSSTDRRDCDVNGSAVVSNNRLIMVDYNNNKVKLIDTQSNKVISELTVSRRPWDVTVISRNQAAFTLYSSHKILLLKVLDTLTLDREITVGGQCRGVAYSKNRLFVTYINPVKLEILDLSGKAVKKIENDSYGNKLFSDPHYVCVSSDGETIYVSDYSNKKVISLNVDGVVKSVYSDTDLQSPWKVCVDKDDNVFVCCRSNVHMLTANLSQIKIILTQQDGLGSNVCSVSHCQETNRLYVGMEYNKVKVYQLSQ